MLLVWANGALVNPISVVSEYHVPGVMQFCITLDISTTASARTLKLGHGMHQ